MQEHRRQLRVTKADLGIFASSAGDRRRSDENVLLQAFYHLSLINSPRVGEPNDQLHVPSSQRKWKDWSIRCSKSDAS